jgi:hypothetical protein
VAGAARSEGRSVQQDGNSTTDKGARKNGGPVILDRSPLIVERYYNRLVLPLRRQIRVLTARKPDKFERFFMLDAARRNQSKADTRLRQRRCNTAIRFHNNILGIEKDKMQGCEKESRGCNL